LAKQNGQKTLAYRNATFCTDAYSKQIHRSGSELLPEKTTTYPDTKWVTAAAGAAESFLPVVTA